jgi:hypothetical protein
MIEGQLDELGFEPRTIGRSDYPTDFPLREVYVAARHCSGGVVLGFSQLYVEKGLSKVGTAEESEIVRKPFPSPWNQIESGILFAVRLPLLVFREVGVEGGIFDLGSSDLFVQTMPPSASVAYGAALRDIILKWGGKVREHYISV